MALSPGMSLLNYVQTGHKELEGTLQGLGAGQRSSIGAMADIFEPPDWLEGCLS